MSQPSDQRRGPRATIDLFIEETVDGETHLHPAVDLSLHGMYVLVEDDRRAVDPAALLELAFTLPGGHPVRTKGRIVHVDDHRGRRGLRIAFNGVSDDDREAIKACIDAQLGKAEEPLANVS